MRFRNFVMTAVASAIAVLVSTFWLPTPFDHTQATTQVNESVSQPRVTLTKKYYVVKGETANQIRHHLNQVGPFVQGANRRFDAYTHWQIRWQYWYTKVNHTCSIHKATVSADVAMTLPQWQPSRAVAMALSDRWNTYITALKAHEAGHQQNGINASDEILAALQTLPSYATCAQLSQAASAAGNGLIQKYAQRDSDYDHTTQHGASQGAMFP